MPNTTTTQVPPGVQAFYDRNLLTRAVPNNVHGKFAQTRPLPSKASATIKFRRYSNLASATAPLTEGTTPAGKQLSVTDITATVQQYGDFVTITDAVDLLVEDKVLTEAGEVLGDQAGLTKDELTRDVLSAGTNVIYANGVARNAVNTTLTVGILRTVVRTLRRSNAQFISKVIKASNGVGTSPVYPGYFALVHPDATAVLKGITGFTPVAKYPNPSKAVNDFEIGAFEELRFIESTNCKIWPDAGGALGTMISTSGVNADVYSMLVFAANAYGEVQLDKGSIQKIVKGLGSAGSADPLNQRSTAGWKMWHVAKILNESFMLRVEHGCTDTL